ncbi:MAG: hypothetical protein ABIR47_15745, partial [Candidatus Kapaibacterium sp.]
RMRDMETLQYTRAADIPAAQGTMVPVTMEPFLGSWINTNSASRGITSFTLTQEGDAVMIHPVAAESPADWGSEEITAYAAGVDGGKLSAFNALFDAEFVETFLAANLNAGLIIIAAYTRFKDGSDRSNYFSREFYYHDK